MGEAHIPRKEFIRLTAAAGLVASAASLMAACGGGEVPEAGKTADGVTIDGVRIATKIEPAVGPGEMIARESEVAPDSAVRFIDAETEQPAMLIRLQDGRFVAYGALCTHEKCPVFYQPGDRRIACPCHGAVFNPAKGGVAEIGPAQVPLPQMKVEVRDGRVVRA